jgi:hypothetical protein
LLPDSIALFTISTLRLSPSDAGGTNQMENGLEALLKATSSRKATDPRDHVYALLGIVSDPGPAAFELDYMETTSTAYQRAIVSIFRTRNDLDWLVYSSLTSQELPSWCPDFSMETWERAINDKGWVTVTSEMRDQRNGAGASTGKELTNFYHDLATGTISPRGVMIGKVQHILPFTCGHPGFETGAFDYIDAGQTWRPMMQVFFKVVRETTAFTLMSHDALKMRNDLGPEEVLQKLAAGDVWKVASHPATSDAFIPPKLRGTDTKVGDIIPIEIGNGYAILEKFVRKVDSCRSDMSREWAHLLPEDDLQGFGETALLATWKYAHYGDEAWFFTTNSGYFGRAGHPVRSGDLLVILFGCRYPAVLRLQMDGTYRIVTFTCTHDIMEGEYFSRNPSYIEQTFVLR